jgi:CO/xanthine dehydrogenase Mo-binding subunit
LIALAEIEVDTKTGETKGLKTIITQVSGHAINPINMEGQLEGGPAWGVGYALFEDFLIVRKSGVTITDRFATYRIRTALDLLEIEVVLVENVIASSPFGERGVGEMGSVCMAPPIANTICDAVGVRVNDLPVMPEKVFKA